MKNVMYVESGNGKMRLTAVGDNIIRCTYSLKEIKDIPSIIIEEGKNEPIESAEADGNIFSAKNIRAVVDEKTCAVKWEKTDGTTLIAETKKEFIEVPVEIYTTDGEEPVVKRVKTVDGERNFIQNLKKKIDHYAFQGRLHFGFSEDEGIYGLGQAEEGVFNYRHHIHYMYQHNMRIPMPMFISDNGYGILFDCTSLMTFNDNEAGSYMYFDAIDQLDYYVVVGNVDEVIRGFRYLTGEASMLPKWAFGYVQSKEQYYSAAEMAEVVKHYRELGVPLDCIVQDWNSWPEGQWGQKSLDEKRYSDVKEKMKEIHDMNVHTMVSVWPNMNTGTPNHTELFEKGHMLNDLATYDAFNEEARRIYWQQARDGLYEMGFDSWWCDSTEPFSGPDWGGEIKREPWVRFDIVGTEHKKYLSAEKANVYSLLHAKGMYENQRRDYPDKRMLNLTRSGYASGQKYGAMLWSGDITAAWSTIKQQIAEGLNMAMSGYPYWTLDIGGFFTVGKEWQRRGCSCNTDPTPKWFWKGIYDYGVEDKGYCELYTRWIEMGCFLPMFRSHGTDTPREIWNFGEKGTMFYDAIEKFINLRYQLMPYIYSMAGSVRLNSDTIMRSLVFDFSEDKIARKISSQFMFGRSILVCPVTEPMYFENESREIDAEKKTKCYLPAGADWYDFWTGKKYEGGQYIVADTPIDIMPVFVRAGSIIPMAKGLQYASQKLEGPIEIHIYSGADGEFTLYDDNGEDYSYEDGAYSTVKLTWKDDEKKLVIGEREGSFSGMSSTLNFTVIVDGEVRAEVSYNGEKTDI